MPGGTTQQIAVVSIVLSLLASVTAQQPPPRPTSPGGAPPRAPPVGAPPVPPGTVPPGTGGSGGFPGGGRPPSGPPPGGNSNMKVPGFVIVPPQLAAGVGDQGWLSLQGEGLGLLLAAQGNPLIVTRTNFIVAVAGYEALAACTRNKALILGTRFKRTFCATPAGTRTVVYVSIYRTLTTLFGADQFPAYTGVLRSAGINPANESQDTNTTLGLGNAIGAALAQYFFRDGANQLGDEGGVEYNRIPFSDYTGYKPVNSVYEIKDLTRWQPLRRLVSTGGSTYVQEFVAAHFATLKTLTVRSTSTCAVREPWRTKAVWSYPYTSQARYVLRKSEELDDAKKMQAEFFDFGGNYAQIIVHLSNKYNWTLTQQIKWHFAFNLAGWDTINTVIFWKRKYDAIRPISVIRAMNASVVRGWGGPRKRTVNMKAREWRPYVRETAPDPEYPSGTTAGISAISEISSWFTGSDELNWNPIIPANSSWVEVNVTPKAPIVLNFPTFASFKQQAMDARIFGGVHFQDATFAGVEIGQCIARATIKFLGTLFDGLA